MMVMHGCLIFCFLVIFPRGFIAYRALSGNNDLEINDQENKIQKNCSLEKVEQRKISSKFASLEHEESRVHYGYDDESESSVYGPRNWGKISSKCDGNAQSPVNIDTKLARRIFTSPLVFKSFDKLPSSIMMVNNGHSAMVDLIFEDESHVEILGGPLAGSYVLDNIHWHWGRRDEAGSEHAIDGTRFAAEMHFVLHSSNFSSANEAAAHPAGLAVLAFIYDLNNKLGSSYNPFVPLLSKVIEPDSTHTETEKLFTIRDLIKSTSFHYVTYEGSLTSPMCYEKVAWIVSTKKLSISSLDLQEFRKIKDEDGFLLLENDRPLQKLNGRDLFSH